jgi:thioredoxin-related protein
MKKILFSALAISAIALVAFTTIGNENYKTLSIGDKAPMTSAKMKNINGEKLNLDGLAKDKGTLVVFTCNTCPFVIQWEDRYPEVAKLAAKNGIGVALINSNEAKRKGDDSIEEMKKHAAEKGYGELAYLVDEKSALANAFGAKTTPHIFLFDKDWKLVYEGAIDDNSKSAKGVEATYLKDALNNLKDGTEINPNNTKAIGCSIKRVKV